MNLLNKSPHQPVLLNEIMTAARGIPHPIEKIFDGTFGRGGHLSALLNEFPTAKALAFDRDPEALLFAQQSFQDWIKSQSLTIQLRDYRSFSSNEDGFFDFMLLDLGVSSPQLDQAERGFSFYQNGPLDMRMDSRQSLTAAEVINTYSENELIRIFRELGEVHKPYRVVRALVHDRKEKPFTETQMLSSLIERVDGWRIKGHHPATRYFMALRLEVNQELEGVKEGVGQLLLGLRPNGRLAVITFHSLEDRIVKYLFKDHGHLGFNVNKKVIIASEKELSENPRSRSAKLRIFQRNPE